MPLSADSERAAFYVDYKSKSIDYINVVMLPFSMLQALFGNETAEKVLLYLANYGEGYAREIASTFELPLLSVQRQLQRLEAGGILVSRRLGNTRMFYFNPRNYFLPELSALLEKALGAIRPDEIQRYYRKRTRPRRTGKAVP